MIKEEKILCGTKKELIEHFYSIIQLIQSECKDNNLFCSREGIEKQINEIEEKCRGQGLLFYMIINIKNEKELKSFYIKVTDYIHPDFISGKIEKELRKSIKV